MWYIYMAFHKKDIVVARPQCLQFSLESDKFRSFLLSSVSRHKPAASTVIIVSLKLLNIK